MPDLIVIPEKTVTDEATPSDTVNSEAVETVAESAVEIAEIEAAKEIELAEIRAETEVTAIETAAEVASEQIASQEGLEECRASIATLTTIVQDLTTEVHLIQAKLMEPEPSPQSPSESPESLEPTRDSPEPAPEPQKKRRKLRLI